MDNYVQCDNKRCRRLHPKYINGARLLAVTCCHNKYGETYVFFPHGELDEWRRDRREAREQQNRRSYYR